MQADRALDRTKPGGDREVDAWQFCIAVRQVRRAAELVVADLGTPSDALAAFDKRAPGVVQARDAIDHFDDYAKGVGNLAHPGVKVGRREPSEEGARSFETRYIEHPDGTSIVTVGDVRLDIGVTAAAVDQLVQDLLEAAGFSDMGEETPEVPPFDPRDPHGYAMMLSWVSRTALTAEDYQTFLDALTEQPDQWPPLAEVQNDLGDVLPMNLAKPLRGGQRVVVLAPVEYQGRRIDRPDGLELVDVWIVVIVPWSDGTWRIRTYTRDSTDYQELQLSQEDDADA